MIIGSPFPNSKELEKIAEEYGDMFGGADNLLKIYKIATPEKYDFLHLDLQENPPIAYHNFEKQIAVGPSITGDSNIDISDLKDDTPPTDDASEYQSK